MKTRTSTSNNLVTSQVFWRQTIVGQEAVERTSRVSYVPTF